MVNEVKNLLEELIRTVFEVNLRTKHSLFLDFSGHTNTIHCYYYKNGWSPDKNITNIDRVNLYEDSIISDLKRIIKSIRELEE